MNRDQDKQIYPTKMLEYGTPSIASTRLLLTKVEYLSKFPRIGTG